jgi:hypothetical protein
MAALDVSSAYPGKIKCDYYSAEGRSGTSYNGMPYYQPERALSILARRSRDPRGFYRPCLEDEFFAFTYHLCYHKGHRAGIPTGTDVAPDTDAPRDYLAELKRLAIKAQRNDLPENITLLGLHHYLVRNKWGMPYDLMLRWPDSHPFMEALTCFEEAAMEEDCPLAKDLTIIVLRDDCDSPELEEIARQKIAERFTIGQEIRLDGAALVLAQLILVDLPGQGTAVLRGTLHLCPCRWHTIFSHGRHAMVVQHQCHRLAG